MTTYQMTEHDKAVSFRRLRDRLLFRGLLSAFEPTNDELRAALCTIPDIDRIDVLQRVVWNDGVWAAQQVLKEAL